MKKALPKLLPLLPVLCFGLIVYCYSVPALRPLITKAGFPVFAALLWLSFSFEKNRARGRGKMPRRMFWGSVFAGFFVYLQSVGGTVVSENRAALACPDFPLCLGEFIPTLTGLVGLHVWHRLGAYVLAIVVVSLYLYASHHRNEKWMDKRYFNITGYLVMGVLCQIGIGAVQIWLGNMPQIAIVHLATSAFLLGLIIRLLFLARLHTKG